MEKDHTNLEYKEVSSSSHQSVSSNEQPIDSENEEKFQTCPMDNDNLLKKSAAGITNKSDNKFLKVAKNSYETHEFHSFQDNSH